ncbi:hypothetical protein V6W59_06025 [Mannheimia sp. HC-2023]|uniref:hypothetical protein n=1 Tax=Mannheimia indoligenes TaxID=3103145 RepID=UPI002FE5C20B
MYKQFLKSILLATVATFSLSTVVSAKPIPKNATYNQIYDGLETMTYTVDDLIAEVKKGQPSSLGYVAYMYFQSEQFDDAYNYAQRAVAKNDTLGKFITGNLYVLGHKGNFHEGIPLIKKACVDGKLGQKFSKSDLIVKVCKTAKN